MAAQPQMRFHLSISAETAASDSPERFDRHAMIRRAPWYVPRSLPENVTTSHDRRPDPGAIRFFAISR
jgi:hypothetical protein